MTVADASSPDDHGVPLDALRRSPTPTVRVLPPMRHTAAARSVGRRITRNLAVAQWQKTGCVADVAVAIGRSEEYVRELLAEAGVRAIRRRCGPSPRGGR